MRRAVAIAVLALGLLEAQDASAKDLNGRIGIGGAKTLGGVQGIDVIYWAGKLGLNGTLNIYLGFPGNPGEGADPKSFNVIKLAIGALYPLLGNERVELAVGGRVNFGIATDQDAHLALEGPLRLEWYVTDHFSVHAEVGLVVDLIPKSSILNGVGPSSSKGTAIVIGGTYVTGGGGFTVIF